MVGSKDAIRIVSYFVISQLCILFFIIIFLFHNVKKTFSKRRMPDDRLIFIVAASIARFRECV